MAKVLVVDDNAGVRRLLVALLATRNHMVIEAGDGEDALRLVQDEHPQLVVSDILMPTMDGYEFVRRLRSIAGIAHIEVIFFTAEYHEREAHDLASSCGVAKVLCKPCPPEEILDAVDAALERAAEPAATDITGGFDVRHMRLMTDKLTEKSAELQAANSRLAALCELNLDIAAQRDPRELLERACRGARDIIGTKYAVLQAEFGGDGPPTFITAGVHSREAFDIEQPLLDSSVLGQVQTERKTRRLQNPGGQPGAIGLPWHVPFVHSCLIAPIASPARAYGWLCLIDKLGARSFSEEDERTLTLLADQAGCLFENCSLYGELEQHTAQLQKEITERERSAEKIEHLNRVHAVLSATNALIVRVSKRDELFSEACRVAVEHGEFRVAWIGLFDAATGALTPIAWAGNDPQFANRFRVPIEVGKAGKRSLTAEALTTRACAVCNDLEAEAESLLFGDEIVRAGHRSNAVLPLTLGGKAVGCLVLYASEKGFFDEAEVRLLTELAGDISFALDHIDKAERLDYLAYYDSLTGLANRTLLLQRLSQDVRAAERAGRGLALVIADVDRFDVVNDTFGRHVGDGVLRMLADRFVRCVGDAKEVARVGADQIAAIIPDMRSENEMLRIISSWWAAVFGSPFSIDGSDIKLTAKGGIALFPTDAMEAGSLLRNAESALKNAKSGSDTYLFYTQDMSERTAERLALEIKLRRALDHDEFILHYQPKVDVETRRIVGLEALMRWQSPELGLVPPGTFIPVLEDTGLIGEAGAWALKRALLDRISWTRLKLAAPRIAVNVSTIQLRSPEFVPAVAQILALANGQDHGIDIEVTESLIMEDVDSNIEKLRSLQALGVASALDDFGTGYSSLGYLARLPVSTLKIDRSFVSAMMDDRSAMTLVSTIISLAHALKLTVVAEGVETEEQANLLRVLGCDQMQGFLISKPLPLQDTTALLAARQRRGGK